MYEPWAKCVKCIIVIGFLILDKTVFYKTGYTARKAFTCLLLPFWLTKFILWERNLGPQRKNTIWINKSVCLLCIPHIQTIVWSLEQPFHSPFYSPAVRAYYTSTVRRFYFGEIMWIFKLFTTVSHTVCLFGFCYYDQIYARIIHSGGGSFAISGSGPLLCFRCFN